MLSSKSDAIRHYKLLGRVLCRDDGKSGLPKPISKGTLSTLYGALISLQRIIIAGQSLGDVVEPLRDASFRHTLTSFTFVDAILSPKCTPFRDVSAQLPQLESFHLAEWKDEKLSLHVPVDLSDALASLGLSTSRTTAKKGEPVVAAQNVKSLHLRRFQWSDEAMERELGASKGPLTELRLIVPSHALDGLKYIDGHLAAKLRHLSLDLPGQYKVSFYRMRFLIHFAGFVGNKELDSLIQLLLRCNTVKHLSISAKRLPSTVWVVGSPSITHLTVHGLDVAQSSNPALKGDLHIGCVRQFIIQSRFMTNLKTFIYDPVAPEVIKLTQMTKDVKSTTKSDIDMLYGVSGKLDFARQPFILLSQACEKRSIVLHCPAAKALQKMQREVDGLIAALKRQQNAYE